MALFKLIASELHPLACCLRDIAPHRARPTAAVTARLMIAS